MTAFRPLGFLKPQGSRFACRTEFWESHEWCRPSTTPNMLSGLPTRKMSNYYLGSQRVALREDGWYTISRWDVTNRLPVCGPAGRGRPGVVSQGNDMNNSSKPRYASSQSQRILGVLIFLSILAGCGCSNDMVFDDVLQSECAPPCWRGIVPGVTTRDEVRELLDKEAEVDEPSFPIMRWGSRCVKGRALYQVEIWFDRSDVVVSVTLAEADPIYTFADVVTEHGTPSAVMINECSPESNLGFIYLVYHKDGMAFASGFVPVLGEPWQTPSAKERVYQWYYFVPTSTDKMLLQDGVIPGCGLGFYSSSSEWSGFEP